MHCWYRQCSFGYNISCHVKYSNKSLLQILYAPIFANYSEIMLKPFARLLCSNYSEHNICRPILTPSPLSLPQHLPSSSTPTRLKSVQSATWHKSSWGSSFSIWTISAIGKSLERTCSLKAECRRRLQSSLHPDNRSSNPLAARRLASVGTIFLSIILTQFVSFACRVSNTSVISEMVISWPGSGK